MGLLDYSVYGVRCKNLGWKNVQWYAIVSFSALRPFFSFSHLLARWRLYMFFVLDRYIHPSTSSTTTHKNVRATILQSWRDTSSVTKIRHRDTANAVHWFHAVSTVVGKMQCHALVLDTRNTTYLRIIWKIIWKRDKSKGNKDNDDWEEKKTKKVSCLPEEDVADNTKQAKETAAYYINITYIYIQ